MLNGISTDSKKKLETQLNWGLRVCFKTDRYAHCNELRHRAKLLNADIQREYFTLCKFASIVSCLSIPFRNGFPNFSGRTNARSELLHTVKYRKQIFKESFLINATNFWNKLPRNIRDVKNEPKKFKKWLKNYLLIRQNNTCHIRNFNTWNANGFQIM